MACWYAAVRKKRGNTMKVERLHEQDYEEFLDFVDQVFSQDLIRVHFQEDMPLLFKRDEAHMQMQYACRDERGRIRAAIGVIPYRYQVGDEEFSARTITNVATHYRYTGRGYMQSIFQQVFADMRREQVDFAVLHGNRERYRHTGFEMAGTTDVASFQRYNIPNRQKRGERYDFQFYPITDGDTELIGRCLELYHAEGQHYVRTASNFMDFQRMWEGRTYAVLDWTGAFCGYLNFYTRFGIAIRELLLTCPEQAASVIYSFMIEHELEEVQVYPSPFDPVLNSAIYEAAEYVTSGQTTRLNLLRPERFLQACLELKRQRGAYMPNGELVLDSPAGRLLISHHGTFRVQQTARTADIQLSGAEFYSLLFGPAPRVFSPYAQTLGPLSSWFPVPFFIHYTDLY